MSDETVVMNKTVGDYEIVSRLGGGGFGDVYRAKSNDGQTVAIKLLNTRALGDDRVVNKFFDEAVILASLKHDNITKLIRFFPHEENYALVMEFVEGTELKEILQEHPGPLPFDQGYRIANQALDALQYAYRNGILHRDIKPANILIDKKGDCKIMDFGIAKMSSAADHHTAANMLSVRYAAPERFDSTREVDVRSDIYSLGLVLYEIFAGRFPFLAEETAQVMHAHLAERPLPPVEISPSLPRPLSAAISKALEKEPDDRFQDLAAFKAAIQLDAADLDETVVMTGNLAYRDEAIRRAKALAKPAGIAAEGKKSSKTGWVIGVLVLLAVLVAGGAWYVNQPPSGTLNPPPVVSTPEKPVEPTPPEPAAPVETEPSPKVPPPETEPIAAPKPHPNAVKNNRGFYEVDHPEDGARMVFVPAGEFTMGSDEYSFEKPVQKIVLDDYWIDKHPVTNGRFKKYVDATGYKTDAEKAGFGRVRYTKWKKQEGAMWRLPDGLTPIEGKDEYPVSQVSFNDAQAYCRWAGKSLPTEAQWEKAARGPDGNVFPWGDAEPNDTMANYDRMEDAVTPVNKYPKGRSHYEVTDMAGNIYQWCRDWYGEYNTGERASANPVGPADGSERVIKGGSFQDGMDGIRSATRAAFAPDYSSFLFGFRCATGNITH